MFSRVRDIEDAFGSRLRLSVEAREGGTVVTLSRPDRLRGGRALLDLYGAEVLRAYIEAARLALPNDFPDESVEGAFPARLRLRREPSVALLLTQAEHDYPLAIPATFWDRLQAELGMVTAHARELERRARARLQVPVWSPVPAAAER